MTLHILWIIAESPRPDLHHDLVNICLVTKRRLFRPSLHEDQFRSGQINTDDQYRSIQKIRTDLHSKIKVRLVKMAPLCWKDSIYFLQRNSPNSNPVKIKPSEMINVINKTGSDDRRLLLRWLDLVSSFSLEPAADSMFNKTTTPMIPRCLRRFIVTFLSE